MARNYLDEGKVRQRAAEMLFDPAYQQALQEAEVEPFGGLNPDIDAVDFPADGTFTFKAMVPLRPIVTLGPYKGLDLEKRNLEISDADVDRQIEDIRIRQAEYPEVTDRNAQTGDVILAELQATIEGQESNELAQPRATVIEIGKNIPDFDEGLVGMAIAETKTIDALYPESFADENLRGKRATFTVTVKEIRARVLPELNEEFIAKARPGATTEEELRASIRESLEESAVEMAENDLEFSLVGKIVDNSQVFFPDALLRAEMQTDINELTERLKRDNATFEQYLRAVGKTAQQVQNEMAGAADRRIRNSLVLSEIARTEALTVEDEDIDAQIADRAERANVSPAAVRAFIEKNDQMNQIRDQALTEKILNYLREVSHITERTVTRAELENAPSQTLSIEATEEAEAAVAFDGEAVVDEAPVEVPVVEEAAETSETPETVEITETPETAEAPTAEVATEG
jgi:trigger factor